LYQIFIRREDIIADICGFISGYPHLRRGLVMGSNSLGCGFVVL
jgi:hypothetical protein